MAKTEKQRRADRVKALKHEQRLIELRDRADSQERQANEAQLDVEEMEVAYECLERVKYGAQSIRGSLYEAIGKRKEQVAGHRGEVASALAALREEAGELYEPQPEADE